MSTRLVRSGTVLVCFVFQFVVAVVGGVMDAIGVVIPNFSVLAAVPTACLVLLSVLAGWMSSARLRGRLFGAGLLLGGAMFTRACLAAMIGLVFGTPTSASFVLTTLILGALGLALSLELLLGKTSATTNRTRGLTAAD